MHLFFVGLYLPIYSIKCYGCSITFMEAARDSLLWKRTLSSFSVSFLYSISISFFLANVRHFFVVLCMISCVVCLYSSKLLE